jgi:hypothetical protein
MELVGNCEAPAKGSLNLTLWPNWEQYCKLVSQYSRKKLTFNEDALNAFSAVTNVLEPSFPGGFFFGLPEFFFSVALLWMPGYAKLGNAKPDNQIRRKEFPSWSWLGWEQKSFLSDSRNSSLLRGFELSPASSCKALRQSAHIPLVKWHKEDTSTNILTSVDDSFHEWQSFIHDSKRDLPPGWRRKQRVVLYRDVYLWDQVGIEHGMDDEYFEYLHDSVDNNEPEYTVRLHPAPMKPQTDVFKPTDCRKWSPYLHGRVCMAKLTLGELAFHKSPNYSYFHVLGSDGRWCGTMRPNQPDNHTTGEICGAISLTRGKKTLRHSEDVHLWRYHISEVLGKDWITSENGDSFETIRALWIRFGNGIVYRVGTGVILAHAWDRLDTEGSDIVLG